MTPLGGTGRLPSVRSYDFSPPKIIFLLRNIFFWPFVFVRKYVSMCSFTKSLSYQWAGLWSAVKTVVRWSAKGALPKSIAVTILTRTPCRALGLLGTLPIRVRGGEGALAPSCRLPHGHDQTREIFLFPRFFSNIAATQQKPQLRQWCATPCYLGWTMLGAFWTNRYQTKLGHFAMRLHRSNLTILQVKPRKLGWYSIQSISLSMELIQMMGNW